MGVTWSPIDTPVVVDHPQVNPRWTRGAPGGTGIRLDVPTEWTARAARGETLDWYWDEPMMVPFDGKKLCNTNILFVGDSLTQHTYFSFLVQLGAIDHYPQPIRVKSHKLDYIIQRDECNIELSYRRNDWLVLNDIALPYENANANEPWKNLVEPADFIIINQGAHFLREKNFTTNVRLAFEFLKDKRVLYLSVPPGYPNCMAHKKPVETTPDLQGAPHHWDLIPGRNLWVKKLIENNGNNKHKYVDVMDMSLLRADAHVSSNDCLHFTFPGVYDWWVYKIFNEIIKFLYI